MRLRLFVFAEYGSAGTDNKLTIAGIIDGVNVKRRPGTEAKPGGTISLPPIYMVAVVEGSISDGLTHALSLRFLNDDAKEVTKPANLGRFSFVVNPLGRPMSANLIVQLGGLVVPGPGDYILELLVGGRPIGEAPFYVTDVTATG